MKRIAAFALTISAIGNAAAPRRFPHVKDPHHVLEKVDAFEARGDFDKTVRCGVALKYEMHLCAKRCEPYTCDEYCDASTPEFVIQTRDCSGEAVTYFNVTLSRPWFSIKKSEFHHSSFLRFAVAAPFVGEATKPGEPIGKNYVVMKSAVEEDFALKSGKTLKAIRAYYDYFQYDEKLKRHFVDPQSIVFGKYAETMGLHLEHNFERLKKPVARVTEIAAGSSR